MTSTTYVIVEWELVSPGGVVTPDPYSVSREPDVRITTDGRGQCVIPGFSLAGSLRAHAAALGELDVSHVFGTVAKEPESATIASRVSVTQGTVVVPASLEVHTRTAIDRVSGAARNRTLRVREALPAGSTITAHLTFSDLDEASAAALERALVSWAPTLGGGVSVGSGRTKLTRVGMGTLDLRRPADLLTHLTHSGSKLHRQVVGEDHRSLAAASVPPSLQVDLRIEGSLAIGDGTSTETDGRKVSNLVRSNGGVIVPGSTLKGVLRSRIEFVLRSLMNEGGPCLDGQCAECVVCHLFGCAGGGVSRRSRLRFHDSPIQGSRYVQREHVAIDRFTGGAADGLLYTRGAVEGGHLTVRVEALREEDWELGRALVLLALYDLDAGLVGVGSSVTRGYGQLRVSNPSATDVAQAQAIVRAWLEAQEGRAA